MKQIKIPNKLVERILKENKISRVSKDAKEFLAEEIKKELEEISLLALRNAEHLARKTIIKEDIEYALKNLRRNK